MKIIKRRSGKHQITLTANEFAALEQIIAEGWSDAKRAAPSGATGFGVFKDGLTITDDRSNEPPRPAPAGFGKRATA